MNVPVPAMIGYSESDMKPYGLAAVSTAPSVSSARRIVENGAAFGVATVSLRKLLPPVLVNDSTVTVGAGPVVAGGEGDGGGGAGDGGDGDGGGGDGGGGDGGGGDGVGGGGDGNGGDGVGGGDDGGGAI